MFRSKSLRHWSVGLLVAFGVGVTSFPAQAFTITPARLTITAEGGSQETVKITISNPEAIAITVAPRVVGVKQDVKGRTIVGSGFDEAEGWVTPETGSINIPSGGKREVVFSVAVPSGTAPGSHYVGLALATPTSRRGGSGAVPLAQELVSLLTVQVAGVVSERVEITNWKLPNFSISRLVPATIEMRNSGTVEVPLAGQLTITNVRGRQIFSEPLPLGNKLLSFSSRHITPVVNLTGASLYPGPYRATLRVTYGLTRQTVARSFVMWYWPLWSLGVGALLIVMAVFIIRRPRRSSKRN